MFKIYNQQHVNFYHRLTVAMEILIGGTQPILERIERVRFIMNAGDLTVPEFIFNRFFEELEKVKTSDEAEEVALHLLHVILDQFQVIIKDSDHTINGIRRSVKASQLNAEQVAIHFFNPYNLETTQVISPQLDNSGNIDTWPEGFFDQFDKDMNHFAGWEN